MVITVQAEGVGGDYEYQLDGGNFRTAQLSMMFHLETT
jgi:hypothetical protein